MTPAQQEAIANLMRARGLEIRLEAELSGDPADVAEVIASGKLFERQEAFAAFTKTALEDFVREFCP